jgi:hypothetical protein
MMANNVDVLLRFLADNEQAKMKSMELREKLGADFDAVISKSKVGTSEINKATQSAAAASAAGVASSTDKIRNELSATNVSFATTARSVSSMGRGIENVLSGNVLSSIRNFGIFSRTAFSPSGPLAYAESLNELSTAESGLATAQEGVTASTVAMNAASNLSFGTIGLGILAVGALTIGLLKWLGAEQELTVISKEQIETTQRRIEVLKRELEVTLSLAAANGDEAAKRELIIEAKRKELAQNLEEQHIQENALVNELIKALDAQEQAEIRLNNARIAAIQTGGNWESTIKADSDALAEKQKKVKEVTDAVDVYSTATGKNKGEIFSHVLALSKESDALGHTHNLFEDLVGVLGLTIDAQGRLIPSMDAVTAAINRQTDAIKKQNQELEARARNREATIRSNVEQIADMNLTDAQAKRELRRRQADSLFTDSKYGDLYSSIRKNRQVSKLTDTLNDEIMPPKDKGGAEKARRDDERELGEQLRGIEQAYKSQTTALQREYKLQLTNLDDFVERSIAAENERYEKTKAVLERQINLSKPGTAERAKYDRELVDAERQRTDNVQKINDEANQKRIDSLQAHQNELLKLTQDFENRYATSARAAAEARGTTYEDAEQKILDFQTAIFDQRLAIVAREEQRYAENTEAFRKWNDEHKRIIEEQVAFQEDADRRLDEARQKDIDSLLKATDVIYNTELQYEQQARDSYRRQLDDYAKYAARHLILTKQQRALELYARASLDQEEETSRYAKEMAKLRADEASLKATLARTKENEAEKLKIETVYNELREAETQRHIDEQNRINKQADESTRKATEGDEGGGIFGGIREDLNNIPDLSPHAAAADAVTIAYKNMKQAVLDSVDAFVFSTATIGQVMRRAVAQTLADISKEAAIQGIKQTALSLSALAVGDFRGFAMHGLAAAAWFSITAGTALAGRAVMGSSLQNQQAGGAGVGSGAGGDNAPQYRPFTYGGGSFSASEANAQGSRTGNMLADVLKEVVASNNRVADGHAQVAAAVNYNTKVMAGLESVPPGDLIRQNPYAVGDSLQYALDSSHGIAQDIASIAEKGNLSMGSHTRYR